MKSILSHKISIRNASKILFFLGMTIVILFWNTVLDKTFWVPCMTHGGGARGVPQADHRCECRAAGVCSEHCGNPGACRGRGDRSRGLCFSSLAPPVASFLTQATPRQGQRARCFQGHHSDAHPPSPTLFSGRFYTLGAHRTEHRSRKTVFVITLGIRLSPSHGSYSSKLVF